MIRKAPRTLHDLRSWRNGAAIWIFDLDNTLYPASCRAFDQVERRMGKFIQRFLGLAAEPARELQKRYFREFGTTMRGLMVNHALDPDEYLEFVHDIDLTLIAPSPELDAALSRLEGRKIIFTNGSTRHAQNVAGRLGVVHHFEAVFDIAATKFQPKPDPSAYRDLVIGLRIDPEAAVFFDDTVKNLEPAARLGMTTVWVANVPGRTLTTAEQAYIDFVTTDLIGWLEQIHGVAQR